MVVVAPRARRGGSSGSGSSRLAPVLVAVLLAGVVLVWVTSPDAGEQRDQLPLVVLSDDAAASSAALRELLLPEEQQSARKVWQENASEEDVDDEDNRDGNGDVDEHEDDDDMDDHHTIAKGATTKQFFPQHPQLPPIPTNQVKWYQSLKYFVGRDGSKRGLRKHHFLNNPRPLDLARDPAAGNQGRPPPLVLLLPKNCANLPSLSLPNCYNISVNPRVAGKMLVSSIMGIVPGEFCIASSKRLQLECRRSLANRLGCDYDDDLRMQSTQYLVSPRPASLDAHGVPAHERDCARLRADADAHPDEEWLIHPSEPLRGGFGLLHFPSSRQMLDQLAKWRLCGGSNRPLTPVQMRRDWVVQRHVKNPALLEGLRFKFDVRNWIVVASADPLQVFYHDGFVRVARPQYAENATDKLGNGSAVPFRTETILRSYEETSRDLARDYPGTFPSNYMTTLFREQIIPACVFGVVAQFTQARDPALPVPSTKGFYHVFACDSAVDAEGQARLLECNGFPAEVQHLSLDPSATLWDDMMELVVGLHFDPVGLFRGHSGRMSVRDGFTFKGWKLVYNQLETPLGEYSACPVRSSST